MKDKIPVQPTSDLYKDDEWNKWTNKSDGVDFPSTEKSIGDGEYKLGAEYDVTPLGQNYAFDLEVEYERWEVKKLDSDNSFRLGVEVSTSYTPVIANVIRILEKTLSFKDNLLDTPSRNVINDCISKIEECSASCKTPLLVGLRKNEVAASNLKKADEIINMTYWCFLFEVKKLIIIDDIKVSLYSSIDGNKYDYNLLDAFKKVSVENIPIVNKVSILGGEDVYNRLYITNTLIDDLEMFNNITLRDKLNNIVRSIFKDVKLVLVHEKKGYRPIRDLNKIFCNRITSGLPRCKVL